MENNYINRIIDGDGKAFAEVYYAYRSQFVALFRKNFGLDTEFAQDLYQETCASMNNNIETGRLARNSLDNTKLRAYINNTGKYILYNKRRKRQVPLTFDTEYIMNYGEQEQDNEYDKEMDDKLFIVRASVSNMPMPCSRLLDLVVFQKKKHEEVARIMNYANGDSVKNQRHRCMQKLKDIIVKRFKECGYGQY